MTKEDQYKVYTYLTGKIFKLGVAYLSPLPDHIRGKRDGYSSFNIYEKNDKIKWKDFGVGGEFKGDVFDFVKIMVEGINTYDQAKDYINNMILKSRTFTDQILQEQEKRYRASTVAANKEPKVYHTTEFTRWELLYWSRKLKITKPILIKNRIYGFRGIDWGSGIFNTSTNNDPAFIYDLSEKGDLSSWQIYRPLTKDKKKKWKSWNLKDIPFSGYYLLPETNKNLIFTSGKKDGLVLEMCLNDSNYSFGNPSAEGSYSNLIKQKDEINERFDNVWVLFDGDSAGIKAATKLCELTGWVPIIFEYPKFTGIRLKQRKENNLSLITKDVTEIVENYSYKYLFKILKNIL